MPACYGGAEQRDGEWYCKIHPKQKTVMQKSGKYNWEPNCDECEHMFISHMNGDCIPNCISCSYS